ncbi:hypothetical protein COL5a_007551 [Colletotrichum fioriniae]|nr:hypothetical protein COL5a_007551 [Colletotrichum fioriniae]
MDDIGVDRRVLYAIGAAVILAAPVASHLFFLDTDKSLASRLQRLLRPPPQYAHDSLKEGQFRLIHLLPGHDDDDVRIDLTNEWLNAPVKYHAVSYAWGNARDKAYITCKEKEIQITKTLFEALKRWRSPAEEVVLWADSICINQRNTLEKTQQIGRMSEIYSNAEAVKIWLGRDDSNIDGVQDVIKEASEIIPEVVDDPHQNRKSADILATRNEERAREGKSTIWNLDWRPLRALMNHTWFERNVRYGKFSAGGTQFGKLEIIDDKILRCSGMLIDTVEEDGIFWPELPLPPKPKHVPYPLDKMDAYYARNSLRSLNFYKSCVRIASGSDRIQDMTPERLSDFWKTLTSERSQLSDRIDVDLSEPIKTMITNMETWLVSEDPEEANKARLTFVAAAVPVEMTVLAAASPRRFSRTTVGRLCLVPRETKVGDAICLLLGSEVPFVIRPTKRGRYELIGDAYVSGVMDGEAIASGEYAETEIDLE